MTEAAITGSGVSTAPAEESAEGGLPEAVRARAARAERVTRLALAAGGAALAGAGLLITDGAPRARLGVVLGTAFGCFLTNASYQRRLAEAGPAGASPRLFAATVSNAAAGELAIAYRLGGPGVTVTAGAASGLVALGHACDLLASGRADALVAGGVDAVGPSLTRWLGDGGLDAGRVVREAAALLVVEPPAAARARGAAVLGTIVGYASGFEPEAGGDALAATIDAALGDAGVEAGDLRLVVTAAPPALAAMEERALALTLGDARSARVAPKDGAGEAFGAAGALGVLAALAAASAAAAALVLDVCASGHVAALVVRSPEGT